MLVFLLIRVFDGVYWFVKLKYVFYLLWVFFYCFCVGLFVIVVLWVVFGIVIFLILLIFEVVFIMIIMLVMVGGVVIVLVFSLFLVIIYIIIMVVFMLMCVIYDFWDEYNMFGFFGMLFWLLMCGVVSWVNIFIFRVIEIKYKNDEFVEFMCKE